MGGDTIGGWIDYIIEWLKSTPPAWAGTGAQPNCEGARMLKSTPPAWAGTILSMLVQANLLA